MEQLNYELMAENIEFWKVDYIEFISYIKRIYLFQHYCPYQSAPILGRKANMGYLCKTFDIECLYVCAPHLVQLKWT